MNYITIFKEALNTFWHHKSLWIFGILITIFGQGEYGFSVNYRESYPVGQDGISKMPSIPGSDLILKILDNPIPSLIGFSLICLVLWIIKNLICWWSQGSLISMVEDIERNGSTSLEYGWNVGKQRAIPLTITALLFALPTAILNLPAVAGGVWFFSKFIDFYKDMLIGKTPSAVEMQAVLDPLAANIVLGFACIFTIVCIGGILGWLLSLLNKITARIIVLENLTIADSIERGWKITRKNLRYILLNGVVLLVFSIVFGWIAAIPALIIWVPVAQSFLHQNWNMSTISGAVFIGFYFLFIAIGLGGIFTSFNSALWTKLYKAIVGNENINVLENQANQQSE